MHFTPEQPVLRDGDLRLRPVRLPDDIAPAVAWYSDPEVLRYSEGDTSGAYDAEMVGRMYGYLADLGELYIIEVQAAGKWVAIGDATLAPDTLPMVIGVAAYRSRGYGRRAVRLLIERARKLGWRELRVKSIYTFNERSRRLFEGQGFVQDGAVFEDEGMTCWKFVLRLD